MRAGKRERNLLGQLILLDDGFQITSPLGYVKMALSPYTLKFSLARERYVLRAENEV